MPNVVLWQINFFVVIKPFETFGKLLANSTIIYVTLNARAVEPPKIQFDQVRVKPVIRVKGGFSIS